MLDTYEEVGADSDQVDVFCRCRWYGGEMMVELTGTGFQYSLFSEIEELVG